MAVKFKFHCQPRIKGRHRDPLPSCVLHDISTEVDRLARRYKVSRSWVIATILGDAFGIGEQVPYYKGVGMSLTVHLWAGTATYAQGSTAEQTSDDDLIIRGTEGREIAWHVSGTWTTVDVRNDQGQLVGTLKARTASRKVVTDGVQPEAGT